MKRMVLAFAWVIAMKTDKANQFSKMGQISIGGLTLTLSPTDHPKSSH